MVASREDRKLRLVLASASPRRCGLLAQIGLPPDTIAPTYVNESPRVKELPLDHAKRLAEEKASAGAKDFQGDFVLGADTVVACGRRILPKAGTEAEARETLEMLSGRAHRVTTAISVVRPDGRLFSRVVTTRVVFKRLSPEELSSYIASGEWRDKAGAYAIQGRAAMFVRQIVGSYSNVVGLPLYETASLLKGLGYCPQAGP